MARTAPVPNIPPIPGMCPSVAVLGGGGPGSGGGGDGSASGDGDGPNDGSGNGNGANGADGSAGSCGTGANGACTNCHTQTAAGDPIDVTRGEMFTRPHEDLALGGPITLAVLRSYAQSRRTIDVGMGWGWTHSLAWSIVERRTEVVVREPFGATVAFDKNELHRGAFGAGGWTLYRDPNGSYRLHAIDDFTHTFERGADELVYRLASVEHASRNRVRLGYDARGALTTVVDFAGRTIDVATDAERRIVRLSVTNPRTQERIVYAQYQYTDSGDLARFVDADGHATSYAYDDDHRITRYSHPNGLTFHFVYDKQRRCVESWGDYQGRPDPALDPELPPLLADGATRARGIFHVRLDFGADGYSEVIDSVRVTRYFTDPDTGKISKAVGGDGGVTSRSFDYVGNVAAKSDAESATTTYQWDPFGRLVAESDAIGRTFRIGRDAWGRVVKNVDFDGSTVEVLRDRYGNAEHITGKQGEITTYKFDERSILREEVGPDGGRTRYESDEHGNMTAAVHPDGSVYRWEWDYFGRNVGRTLPNGSVERYEWSPGGLLLAWHEPGRVVRFEYDAMGCVVSSHAGTVTTRFAYGGYRWLYAIVHPDGTTSQLRFNREGHRTKTINESGEVTVWEHAPTGDVVRERLFDGATVKLAYDKLSRRVAWTNGRGRIGIERDAVGRVVGIEWPDGRQDAFVRDTQDHIVTAKTSEGIEVGYERDVHGNVLRESQSVGEDETWVSCAYDVMQHLTKVVTSWGHTLEIQRDRRGRRSKVVLDGDTEIELARDDLGFVSTRRLNGRASLRSTFDHRYRLIERSVETPREAAAPGAEPAWVGAPRGQTVSKRFVFDANDDVVEASDAQTGTTLFRYDARRRLIERKEVDGAEERFSWDATGNLYEAGPAAPARRYGAGNRLEQCGDTALLWDADGALIERRRRDPDGRDAVTRYRWTAEGFLAAVEHPNGETTAFRYDPFGRRVAKIHRAASKQIVCSVRYLWLGDVLLQWRETRGGITRQRTYHYDDGVLHAWAHRDAIVSADGALRHEGWTYYVGDQLGTAEQLIDERGTIVGRMHKTAFGRTRSATSGGATTDARFAGQFEDAETGLHYNHYRYYDPDLGRYISADPLGLDAGLNLYRYCINPTSFVDPLGLASHSCTASLTLHDDQGGGTWVPTAGPQQNPGGSTFSGNNSGRPAADGGSAHGFWSEYRGQQQPQGRADWIPGATRTDAPGSVGPTGTRTGNTAICYAHTEQNSLEWAETNFTDEQLRNSRMRLGGDYPPCPRCHRAMQEFAARHGSKVEYNWPVNNKVSYDGRNASKNRGTPARAPATGSGDWGTKLIDGHGTGNKRIVGYNEHEEANRGFGKNRVTGTDQGQSQDQRVRGSYDKVFAGQQKDGTLGDHDSHGGDSHNRGLPTGGNLPEE